MRLIRGFKYLFMMFCLIPVFVYAEQVIDQTEQKQQQEALQSTIETLQTLLKTSKDKAASVAETRKELAQPEENLEQEAAVKSLEELQTELSQLQNDLESIATGVSVRDYRGHKPEKFDLQQEVEKLIQPMIYALKSITEDSRQIEHLRQNLEQIDQRKSIAITAVNNLNILLAKMEDEELKSELQGMLENWSNEKETLESTEQVITHQLQTRLDSKESLLASTGDMFSGFFKSRGVNFILGIVTFAGVFFLFRLMHGFYTKLRERRGKKSTFDRLADLLFMVFSFFAAIMATLFIFNLRNDWLLLGIGVIFLLALGWIAIKTLPGLVEQIMMILNLGSVREGERVVYNGVPWGVDELGFYTRLINPDLTGGSLHIPIRELIGLVSRPAASNEEWFPSDEGDWVALEDETIGKVLYQSPEMVQIIDFGGSHITYSIDNYLGQNPKNLSRGYRIQMVFGIDYKYQSICTTDVPEKLTAMLKEELIKVVGEDQLERVVVDFFLPNASSLDYEYEAFLKGSAAHLYEEVERTMIYSFANACNHYGWEIPFQQITLHQADSSGQD